MAPRLAKHHAPSLTFSSSSSSSPSSSTFWQPPWINSLLPPPPAPPPLPQPYRSAVWLPSASILFEDLRSQLTSSLPRHVWESLAPAISAPFSSLAKVDAFSTSASSLALLVRQLDEIADNTSTTSSDVSHLILTTCLRWLRLSCRVPHNNPMDDNSDLVLLTPSIQLIHNRIGSLKASFNDFPAAVKCFEEALIAADSRPHHSYEFTGLSHLNMSIAFNKLREHKAALHHATQAANIQRRFVESNQANSTALTILSNACLNLAQLLEVSNGNCSVRSPKAATTTTLRQHSKTAHTMYSTTTATLRHPPPKPKRILMKKKPTELTISLTDHHPTQLQSFNTYNPPQSTKSSANTPLLQGEPSSQLTTTTPAGLLQYLSNASRQNGHTTSTYFDTFSYNPPPLFHQQQIIPPTSPTNDTTKKQQQQRVAVFSISDRNQTSLQSPLHRRAIATTKQSIYGSHPVATRSLASPRLYIDRGEKTSSQYSDLKTGGGGCQSLFSKISNFSPRLSQNPTTPPPPPLPLSHVDYFIQTNSAQENQHLLSPSSSSTSTTSQLQRGMKPKLSLLRLPLNRMSTSSTRRLVKTSRDSSRLSSSRTLISSDYQVTSPATDRCRVSSANDDILLKFPLTVNGGDTRVNVEMAIRNQKLLVASTADFNEHAFDLSELLRRLKGGQGETPFNIHLCLKSLARELSLLLLVDCLTNSLTVVRNGSSSPIRVAHNLHVNLAPTQNSRLTNLRVVDASLRRCEVSSDDNELDVSPIFSARTKQKDQTDIAEAARTEEEASESLIYSSSLDGLVPVIAQVGFLDSTCSSKKIVKPTVISLTARSNKSSVLKKKKKKKKMKDNNNSNIIVVDKGRASHNQQPRLLLRGGRPSASAATVPFSRDISLRLSNSDSVSMSLAGLGCLAAGGILTDSNNKSTEREGPLKSEASESSNSMTRLLRTSTTAGITPKQSKGGKGVEPAAAAASNRQRNNSNHSEQKQRVQSPPTSSTSSKNHTHKQPRAGEEQQSSPPPQYDPHAAYPKVSAYNDVQQHAAVKAVNGIASHIQEGETASTNNKLHSEHHHHPAITTIRTQTDSSQHNFSHHQPPPLPPHPHASSSPQQKAKSSPSRQAPKFSLIDLDCSSIESQLNYNENPFDDVMATSLSAACSPQPFRQTTSEFFSPSQFPSNNTLKHQAQNFGFFSSGSENSQKSGGELPYISLSPRNILSSTASIKKRPSVPIIVITKVPTIHSEPSDSEDSSSVSSFRSSSPSASSSNSNQSNGKITEQDEEEHEITPSHAQINLHSSLLNLSYETATAALVPLAVSDDFISYPLERIVVNPSEVEVGGDVIEDNLNIKDELSLAAKRFDGFPPKKTTTFDNTSPPVHQFSLKRIPRSLRGKSDSLTIDISEERCLTPKIKKKRESMLIGRIASFENQLQMIDAAAAAVEGQSSASIASSKHSAISFPSRLALQKQSTRGITAPTSPANKQPPTFSMRFSLKEAPKKATLAPPLSRASTFANILADKLPSTFSPSSDVNLEDDNNSGGGDGGHQHHHLQQDQKQHPPTNELSLLRCVLTKTSEMSGQSPTKLTHEAIPPMLTNRSDDVSPYFRRSYSTFRDLTISPLTSKQIKEIRGKVFTFDLGKSMLPCDSSPRQHIP